MDWFLYDRDLRHDRVKTLLNIYDGENNQRLKAPSEMFAKVLNTSMAGLSYLSWILIFYRLQFSKKILLQNFNWWKTKLIE